MLTLVTGAMAGIVHVLSGPDHLAAVTPMAIDARRGNRPSFVAAARPEAAEPLVERVRAALAAEGGRFGAHMHVELVNDGPVTVLIDT